MTISVRADLFRLAYSAVSTEETRYYLNGVRIEPHPVKGALLVSTDGQRMVCIYDVDATCDEQAIVQLPKYALALCATKAKNLDVDRQMLHVSLADKSAQLVREVLNKDGLVTKAEPLMTAHGVIIDGTYPDWRKVTPQGAMEPISLSAFNPRYMAELAKIGSGLSSAGSTSAMYFLRRSGGNDGDPVVVRFSRVEHLFAILMPMRADPVTALPDFFSAELPKALAA
jgi:hypothetical protein